MPDTELIPLEPARVAQQARNLQPALTWRQELNELAQSLAYWSGAAWMQGRLSARRQSTPGNPGRSRTPQNPRGCAAILAYHSVADPATLAWLDPRHAMSIPCFEAQMRFLARRRHVIALSALADALDAGRPPQPGTVVITIDDGYRNALEFAAPILQRYNLPATLYLPTGFLQRPRAHWVDRLHTALATATRDELDLTRWTAVLPDPQAARRHDLRQPRVASRIYRLLNHLFIEADEPTRECWLTELIAQLRPAATPPPLTLSWDDVRRLIRDYPLLELGVHTVNHLSLGARHETEAILEIRGAMTELATVTGQPARHFSYPFGRGCPASTAAARTCGLRTASAGGDCLVPPACDLYALPRVNAPHAPARFRCWTAGVDPKFFRQWYSRP